ncbi:MULTISPECIES: ATP-binding cassette domain-containing protein [Methanoculleus]|uniref:Molybdate/tungstate import ATP-binding protein WtpC n=2 Tax=Methanoculleus TaxID=45989 RepID=A3CWR3_METMJ|nr:MULTISPECIES: ATP-binding cassette domain-containing protein [Methanoculleus]ABN57813.1 tungstate/molybdate transport system ATP-binding protein [Methanoculleus marisnigri JR1]MCC7554502.1 ATP-binding cassette domain-containing protein [Methanoculleus marisnigri]UYU19202.1 ATP-binding cassette domain-containing protein [Methanoculleus submarinus]
MLVIDSVSKSLGEFSLSNVSLSVEDGEYFIVLGPTGAGKTILLETIAGVYSPNAGRILLNGRDITEVPARERNIGMVYQDYMLFPHLNVEANIGFGLKSRRADPAFIRGKVEESADLLNISHLLHRYPGTLSGGEQQRSAIARALVMEPEALLLDEPLSALDVKTRESLRAELARIHEATGTTIVHITHNFEEVFDLADRVAIMRGGDVIQVGTPEEIFRRPNSDFVAGFVGVENLLRGTGSANGTVAVGDLRIRAENAIPGPVSVAIRPEEIQISKVPLPENGRNVVFGRVDSVRPNGGLVRVSVEAGVPFRVTLTRQGFEETGVAPGDAVYLAFRPSAAHVYSSGEEEA